jgi:hypothetical protein
MADDEGPKTPQKKTRVFISYTQDPTYPPPSEPKDAAKERDNHRNAVRQLAESLTHLGVKCKYDQLKEANPPDHWPLWVEKQVNNSDFVLMVCSSSYCFHLTNRDPKKVVEYSDRPLSEEGQVTYNLMLKNLRKFIPVFVNQPRCRKYVPVALQGSSIYELSEPFCVSVDKHGPMEMLYARLTSQNPYRPPTLGKVQKLTTPRLGGMIRLNKARSAPTTGQVAQPLEQPSRGSTSQPAMSQPTVSQPVVIQPAVIQPAVIHPVVSLPAMSQPAFQGNDKLCDALVDDDLLTFLGPHIGYWKMLARNLDFSEGEIDNLEYDFKQQEEQGIQMLQKWKKDKGIDAKISILCDAAMKAERRHIVAKIDEYLKCKQ